MKIKGCKELESHSDVKLPVDIPKAKDEGMMKGATVGKDGKEVYGAPPGAGAGVAVTQPMMTMSMGSGSGSGSAKKNGSGNGEKELKKEVELEEDPKDKEVTEGAVCKRNGCGKVYKKEELETRKRNIESESCMFHKGSAIFHEGSKVSCGDWRRVAARRTWVSG